MEAAPLALSPPLSSWLSNGRGRFADTTPGKGPLGVRRLCRDLIVGQRRERRLARRGSPVFLPVHVCSPTVTALVLYLLLPALREAWSVNPSALGQAVILPCWNLRVGAGGLVTLGSQGL